ncbi:MAG: HigA family addiction module antidote protein [Gammaproteobacteria bacterium]|nr:HigA family addiction module antidote protein [Gammaproteobacteria bacterium]MYH47071.1 HigA family addiction module antidote protein [Gammaproteobacteria bacterium]MYL14429.1 HigA family addiction module antidote protein [Gammaproteobacteria bacterium]
MLMHNPPHPGEVVKRQCLQPLGLTVTEAAQGLAVSRNTLSMLLNGRIGISPEMAIRLSQAFGGSPESWLRQQMQYDLWQARQNREKIEIRKFAASILEIGDVKVFPSVVAHCDWSKDDKKCWMSVALFQDCMWKINAPEPISDPSRLLLDLVDRSKKDQPVFIGFDFPIGIPCSYGEVTGFSDFRSALKQFGIGKWENWFSVCSQHEEISIERPFYPSRPGGRSQSHLFDALNLNSSCP